jgi:signal transduction histidine kinase
MESSIKIATFYDTFRHISALVHSSTCAEEVLDLVAWKSAEILNAKGTVLRILNQRTHQLELSAAFGIGERYLSKGVVSSEKVITELCQQNKAIIINDLLENPRIQYPKDAWEEGIRTVLDVPLALRENIVGIIRIYFSEKRKFSQEELDFVIAVAEQCACAIDKARLIEEKQAQYDHLVLQTEKMSALGRMAAGIAHEINNPLAGILLFSSNLIKKVPEKSPLKEGLDVIMHETMRCKTIIQDLLEFSRDKEPQKVSANINTIIEKSLNILENEFRLRHISVDKDLSNEMKDTLVDVNQIEQVFVNLLMNAVEAIQEEGTISIHSHVDEDHEYARIEILDTGCGILPENMPNIFEPFFSTKTKGTGLGLAVSYGIVQNHNGNMKAFSKTGEGTRFVIDIPLLNGGSPRKSDDSYYGTR